MSTLLPEWVDDLGDGIYAVDTDFQRARFDAAYLMVEDGRAAFIDTGTNFAVPRLLALLDLLGLPRSAIDWVIPTHVHLDHAGGAGLLMQALPHATLWIHPRGVRHMVDPSVLMGSALAVYGQEELDRSYGVVQPVAAERVRSSTDGMLLQLAGRPLRFMDTPGHARHHHCIWDERTRGWFTGDTFGLSYRELDTGSGAWIAPTSTPVQFEPEVLRTSVLRLLACDPQCMYLTHYGRVGDVQRLGRLFLELLDGMVAIGRRHAASPDRHQALKSALLSLFCASLQEHGSGLPVDEVARWLAVDIELNAQGIAIWLDRER
jgi:glyoxylase-like metal-dependent hydrolase (beta-lactamase superfamily II)